MKVSRKIRKVFNLYNLSIIACIILIIISLIIIFKPGKVISKSGIEIVQTGVNKDEQISEEDAKKAAVKQFRILGEKTELKDLKVVKIQRKDVEYYYITSAKNTLEISVMGGKIERVNSVLIEM